MQLKYDPVSRAPSSLDGNIRSAVFRIDFPLPRPTFLFVSIYHVNVSEHICWSVTCWHSFFVAVRKSRCPACIVHPTLAAVFGIGCDTILSLASSRTVSNTVSSLRGLLSFACSPLQQSSTVRLQRGHFSLPCTYIVRVHSPQ